MQSKGAKGLVLVQTAKYVLMGVYNDHMYPSICVEAIEKLGFFIY